MVQISEHICTGSSALENILKELPANNTIGDNIIKSWSVINRKKYQKIICSISGGSDSDIMLDICTKCDKDHKIEYVWYDTGLEYAATKEHLKYLEEKYDIEIKRYKAVKPISVSCREYGLPFLNKRTSDYIHRLQMHHFDFSKGDRPFDELYQEYPHCKTALQWWCNAYKSDSLNIRKNKLLKEFLIENPPAFPISDKCCTFSKKKVAAKCIKEGAYQLQIYGVRRSEGGLRATAYRSCFSDTSSLCDEYRPLFWYLEKDKQDYKSHYHIKNSRCYSDYGLKRTGCAGCPFGRDFEKELEIIQKFEPKLYNAVLSIFGKSYEYTRKYRLFVSEHTKNLSE